MLDVDDIYPDAYGSRVSDLVKQASLLSKPSSLLQTAPSSRWLKIRSENFNLIDLGDFILPLVGLSQQADIPGLAMLNIVGTSTALLASISAIEPSA